MEGPYTVAAGIEGGHRVLDALDWEKAYVVGHSWGGHLALHVAEAMPERLLGVLWRPTRSARSATDVGQSSARRSSRRTPESASRPGARAGRAFDGRQGRRRAGARGDASRVAHLLRRSQEHTPPMPSCESRTSAQARWCLESPPSAALEAGLPEIRVPVGFVHGSLGPMPLAASTDGGPDTGRLGQGRGGRRESPGSRPAPFARATAPHRQRGGMASRNLRAVAVSADEARSCPVAAKSGSHGRPSFRVRGKLATLWSEARMNVMLDEAVTAVHAAPEICEEVWWGKRLAAVAPLPALIAASLPNSLPMPGSKRRQAARSG